MEKQYDFRWGEAEVQSHWKKNETYRVSENSAKPKSYCLTMFPYPSGQLHLGHVRTYTLGDVTGRFQRLQGKNVLQPMGWDAFGLPAENAAIKNKVAPFGWTLKNISKMKEQMQSLGLAYDWSRELATCDPDYYRWEQWFFTRLFKKGLVYQKSAWVNWDPVDQTVLANEQVIDGRGWRSDAPVERRQLEQWFVSITCYAEELLQNLDKLPGWPEKIKTMQKNWIGRSEGVQITFPGKSSQNGKHGKEVTVYTTRPDTLMGATYLAVAPQHPIALEASADNPEIEAFLKACSKVKVAEADMAKMEKEGMDTGFVAVHPLTGDPVPIWVANFVLMEYGSGAVMSVPGHDQRDWEFATKYQLPIIQVIEPLGSNAKSPKKVSSKKGSSNDESSDACDISKAAYVSKGRLINSTKFDGMDFDQAFEAISTALVDKGLGEKRVNYRLRDWGVSRQRYWGCPIPIIKCKDCGPVAVPDEDLPVILPVDVKFEGVGSPLKNMPEWYETTCPQCKSPAVRETDTFDTFMESSWYYARFACSDYSDGMLDERAKYWTSVDYYIGGEEHAILHLLYARFFHKVMRDEGLVDTDEPFERFLSGGMVLQDGTKMSKSAGDAGNPQHYLEHYGADALRMAMIFTAPPDQSFEWSEKGVEPAARWLKSRLWNSVVGHIQEGEVDKPDLSNLTTGQIDMRRITHETIARTGDDYGRRQTFNNVVAAVMTLMNAVVKFDDKSDQGRAVLREALATAVIVMSPITPHICQLLWKQLKDEDIEDASWPQVDEDALKKTVVELVVQVNGKVRGKIEAEPNASRKDIESRVREIDNVARFLQGKSLKKVIHVPDKLINFVVN